MKSKNWLAAPSEELTLRQLQKKLPWIHPYSKQFDRNKQGHKDFNHALLHVFKSAGRLATYMESLDHREPQFAGCQIDSYIADLVICALRMANVNWRKFDLYDAVIERLELKNKIKLRKS